MQMSFIRSCYGYMVAIFLVLVLKEIQGSEPLFSIIKQNSLPYLMVVLYFRRLQTMT